ncbi:MAG: Relaxase/mobilization nuclease domain protein [Mucilaginibacter sp.]|nr:Relaxase/mobilization nuclease domain protein [Mucilaginibacter sp.]
MIVHILPPSATFRAVSYNTNKIERDKGELMKVANFGSLQGLGTLRPEDYRQYLQSISALNKRVFFPQFHAVISAKGKAYDKAALTEIATQWLAAMGYGEQPYLIVYHKDTANNHVHIVTTRINKQAKKISSGFENIRAVNNLNKVLGFDEKYSAKQDIQNALTYSISTKAQFLMILESKGYTLKESGQDLEVIKFGAKQGLVSLSAIDGNIKAYRVKPERKAQLKAIFHKYGERYDSALKPILVPLPGGYAQKTTGYTSELAALLKEKFGLTFLFHAKGEQLPYGYSVVDHSGKAVYKGGEIMPLKELLEMQPDQGAINKEKMVKDGPVMQPDKDLRDYYAAILKAALYNYPDLVQGLQHQGLSIIHRGENYILADQGAEVFIDCEDLLNDKACADLVQQLNGYTEFNKESTAFAAYVPGVYIAPDIDDEAINGRNRRRKKKARTNAR